MKYKLTKNTKKIGDTILYQIQAIKSFGSVKKGELGGWIEKESNLAQEGAGWVYGNARVFGDAWVFGKTKIGSGQCFGTLFKGEKLTKTKMQDGTFLIGKK